ncbi:hypothetical protein COM96_28160 [Bacillus cereus]|uniref:Uncharacterized protein n=1 Tax=Bacillus cereus TaxID=1396 RepID=A0A2A7HPP3_BACCE|nr:hypothetical protein COM96_28160 [Bacillus cereus]
MIVCTYYTHPERTFHPLCYTPFQIHRSDINVQTDAKSGDWLFGRGSLDMKSGAAIHLANILYFNYFIYEATTKKSFPNY